MSRTREQVLWDFVEDWLGKAGADLQASAVLLRLEQEDFFIPAFHAQQAAEKYLKAFLVRHQIPFRKTHDLQRLLALVAEVAPELSDELASASLLTPFGTEFRYPGESVGGFEAKSAYREAERVRQAVLAHLEAYLRQGRPQ